MDSTFFCIVNILVFFFIYLISVFSFFSSLKISKNAYGVLFQSSVLHGICPVFHNHFSFCATLAFELCFVLIFGVSLASKIPFLLRLTDLLFS